LPNAGSPNTNPNNPNIGGGSGVNYGSATDNNGSGIGGQLRPDLNRNAQDRQELRRDRQELRDNRQELRDDRQAVRNDSDRSRFLSYNGEWWYWMPGNYWMYYRNNNWNRYDSEAFQPYRYSTGYRGDMDNNNSSVYYDQFGRQYRRDYSPLRRALQRIEGNGGQVNLATPQVDVNTGGAANGTSPNVGVEIGGAAGNR
jgi:hypothetical protein